MEKDIMLTKKKKNGDDEIEEKETPKNSKKSSSSPKSNSLSLQDMVERNIIPPNASIEVRLFHKAIPAKVVLKNGKAFFQYETKGENGAPLNISNTSPTPWIQQVRQQCSRQSNLISSKLDY